MNETEVVPEGAEGTEEIVWLPPKTAEEQVLFDSLLDEIKAMHTFARERGIEVPDTVIDGLSALLAITEPMAGQSESEAADSQDDQ